MVVFGVADLACGLDDRCVRSTKRRMPVQVRENWISGFFCFLNWVRCIAPTPAAGGGGRIRAAGVSSMGPQIQNSDPLGQYHEECIGAKKLPADRQRPDTAAHRCRRPPNDRVRLLDHVTDGGRRRMPKSCCDASTAMIEIDRQSLPSIPLCVWRLVQIRSSRLWSMASARSA